MAGTPPIPTLRNDVQRPLWSVMIPVYNRARYLAEALQSVLEQAPDPDEMEIIVVDDCSPDFDPRPIVDRLGRGRVRVHRNQQRLGIAGTWNECIAQARGYWIHILHDDDMVLPGFYAELRRGIDSRPDVGAAFCRFAYVGESGELLSLVNLERTTPGVLEDWLDRIFVSVRVQCPAIVVRRAVYEEIGGFRMDLRYALDWEMWRRIAVHYPVWYSPRTLAHYRMHLDSETTRLDKQNATISDILESIRLAGAYLPVARASVVERHAKQYYAIALTRGARRQVREGRWREGVQQVRTALRFAPFPRVCSAAGFFLLWLGIRGLVRLVHRPAKGGFR
jgi:hypothetical protein